eukprot:1002075_1
MASIGVEKTKTNSFEEDRKRKKGSSTNVWLVTIQKKGTKEIEIVESKSRSQSAIGKILIERNSNLISITKKQKTCTFEFTTTTTT